jgi:hypothetical protein
MAARLTELTAISWIRMMNNIVDRVEDADEDLAANSRRGLHRGG